MFTSNPRAGIPGRSLGQQQNHVASIRGETPGSLYPPAGVQEETQPPPAQAVGERCQHSCPRWGAARERPLWVGGSSFCVKQRLREEGRPALCMHHWAHLLQEGPGLCPLQLSIPQSPPGKEGKKAVLWSRLDFTMSSHCQVLMENIFRAGGQASLIDSFTFLQGENDKEQRKA